jgi:flagellar FliJ protein
MTRSKKLKPVVQHVDKREQTALQAVAFSQQQLRQQQLRLQQLVEYKQEYIAQQTQPKTCSSLQMQEFQRFLAQLDDTIQRQQQVVVMAERELDIKRNHWKLSRSKSEAMHKVVDRIQLGEQKKADKIEQKLMDEVAQRSAIKSG